MIYEFLNERGERVEVDLPMSRAPTIGSTIRRGGQTLRRTPSYPEAKVAPNFSYRSTSLPKNYMYHEGPFDADGACLFRGIKDVDRTHKRAQAAGEPLVWDS